MTLQSSRFLRNRLARSRFERLLADSRGATMVEYALLLFVVLVVASVAFKTLGKTVRKSADMTAGSF